MVATATKATVKGNKGKGKGKASAKGAKAKASKPRESLATPEDREAAKKCELTPVQYRVLRAIGKAGKSGLTYRGIQEETGYYSILTAVCRGKSGRDGLHPDSLGGKKLITEDKPEKENGSNGPLTFNISPKGVELLKKAK